MDNDTVSKPQLNYCLFLDVLPPFKKYSDPSKQIEQSTVWLTHCPVDRLIKQPEPNYPRDR